MPPLRDLLAAPFTLRSETVHLQDGSWRRTLTYPELGCQVRGEHMMELVEAIEIERVRCLIEAVEKGGRIEPLREPLSDFGVEDLLARAGLDDWIERLDDDVSVG
jgi:hypothetical protein